MRYNVLIVDDDKFIADAIARMVTSLGHNPVTVYSARRAIESLNEAIPEIILLDVQMAGVDGLEVCRYIRRDPYTATVPIIVVSANDDPQAIEAAYAAGADDYIVKPATLDDVAAAIDRLMTGDRKHLSSRGG